MIAVIFEFTAAGPLADYMSRRGPCRRGEQVRRLHLASSASRASATRASFVSLSFWRDEEVGAQVAQRAEAPRSAERRAAAASSATYRLRVAQVLRDYTHGRARARRRRTAAVMARCTDSPHLPPPGRHLARRGRVLRRERQEVRRRGRDHHPARAGRWLFEAVQRLRGDPTRVHHNRYDIEPLVRRRPLDALDLEQPGGRRAARALRLLRRRDPVLATPAPPAATAASSASSSATKAATRCAARCSRRTRSSRPGRSS